MSSQSSGKCYEYTVITHIGVYVWVKTKLIFFIPDANFHLINALRFPIKSTPQPVFNLSGRLEEIFKDSAKIQQQSSFGIKT